ncbi:MAG: hypothetical protein V3V10_05475 [Planctomycetota bacterium]
MFEWLKKRFRSSVKAPVDPSKQPSYKEDSSTARAVRLSLTFKGKRRIATAIGDDEALFRAVKEGDIVVQKRIHLKSWDPRQRLGVSVNRGAHSIPQDLKFTVGQTSRVGGYAESTAARIKRRDEVEFPLQTGKLKGAGRGGELIIEDSQLHQFLAGTKTLLLRAIHTPQPDRSVENADSEIENFAHASILICIGENLPFENLWDLDGGKDIDFGLLNVLEDYLDTLRKHLSRCFVTEEMFL